MDVMTSGTLRFLGTSKRLAQFPVVWLIMGLIWATILACNGFGPKEQEASTTITSPANGSAFQVGQKVEVNISAINPKGILQVELWVDGNMVTSASTPGGQPQTNVVAVLAWTPDSPGLHKLQARSVDNEQETLISAPIELSAQQGTALPPTFTPVITIVPGEPTPTPDSCTPLVLVRARALNVRNGPGTTYGVIGSLQMEQTAEVTGRNAAGTWWQVRFGTAYGWVSASYVTPSCTENVPIIGQPVAPTPTPATDMKFWADSTNINAGQCTTIRWQVDSVKAVYLNEGGADQGVSGHGSKSVCPTNTTTYRLIVVLNNDQRVERQLTVYVQGQGVGINFRADSTNIREGDCTVIRWDVDNAKAVHLSDGHQESGVSGHSSAQVCPGDTTTYVLRVTRWDNQDERREVKIQVQKGPGTIKFWADRMDINKGECTVIRWQVTDAKKVYLNLGQGEQEVNANGNTQVCPVNTTTYNLRVEWQNGQQGGEGLTITVHDDQPAPVVQFSANPPDVHAGETSTLNWNVQNSREVYLDGNPVQAQGSQQVTPQQDTTYTLRVVGLDNSDTSNQVTVRIIIAIATPTINITANPTDITAGECSTLTWDASNGHEFYINAESVSQSGNKQVCPVQTTDYTLRVVTLGTMDAYQTVRVNVAPAPAPTDTQPPPPEPTPTEELLGPGGLPPEEGLVIPTEGN